MKILLIQPFKDFGMSGESYPPVGLGYLATSLKGHDVTILDCVKDNFNYIKFMDKVLEIYPDWIGITLYSISIPYVKIMIDLIRTLGTKIVLGGPHVSALPYEVLKTFPRADYAIQGEGEIPFQKLVNGDPLSEIPGLIYRDNGIKVNKPFFPKNIEDYGFPAWDLINLKDYFKYLTFKGNAAPVFFSRGCPFSCTFCSAKVTSGQMLRRRSIGDIFNELRLLRKHGVKRFIIQDEGFGVEKDFIMRFCKRVKLERLPMKFYLILGMRLDIVDEELLDMMDGVIEKRIALGIESGSERVLKLMKKHTNLKMIEEKVSLMKSKGFEPTGYFIIGFPGETREEIEETIKLALRLPIKEASFTAFQPLPGTEITNELIKSGELPKDYDFSVTNQNTVVYAPKGMTLEELETIRKNAIKRFYLRPKILLHHLKSLNILMFSIKKVFAIWGKHVNYHIS
jgi:anaerobic magnesium-protoporphyrin IX monomethyl ester cyclase